MKFCKHLATGKLLCYSASRAADKRQFEVVEADAPGVAAPVFEEVIVQTRTAKPKSKAKPAKEADPAPAPTADDIDALLGDVDGMAT